MKHTTVKDLTRDHNILLNDTPLFWRADIFYGVTIYRHNGSTEIHRYTVDEIDKTILFPFNIRNEEQRDKMIAYLVRTYPNRTLEISRYMEVSEGLIKNLKEGLFLLNLVPLPDIPSFIEEKPDNIETINDSEE